MQRCNFFDPSAAPAVERLRSEWISRRALVALGTPNSKAARWVIGYANSR